MTPKQKKQLRLKRRCHNQPDKGKRNTAYMQISTWRASSKQMVSWRTWP